MRLISPVTFVASLFVASLAVSAIAVAGCRPQTQPSKHGETAARPRAAHTIAQPSAVSLGHKADAKISRAEVTSIAAPIAKSTGNSAADSTTDSAATADAGPAAPPPLDDGVRPLAYRLRLELDPGKSNFRGHIDIDINIDIADTAQGKRPRDALTLHALELVIDGAEIRRHRGKSPIALAPTVEPHTETVRLQVADRARALGATPASVFAPGRATVSLSFRGKFGSRSGLFRQFEREAIDDTANQLVHGKPSAKPGRHAYIFSDFEPVDARRAFPCFDEPRFKAPWTVSLVVPSGMKALSNMPAVSRKSLASAPTTPVPDGTSDPDGTSGPDGFTLVEFAPTRPLPSYLIAVAVGPFDIVNAPKAPGIDVPIRLVVTRGHAARTQTAAAMIGPLLAIIRDYLAIPVPFPKIDFVSVPEFSGAMENPGLITIASHIVLIDETHSLHQQRLLALVIAHELAHLWFGDLVTPDNWRDLWLNEGFATWMTDKALNAWDPQRRVPLTQVEEKFETFAIDLSGESRPVRRPVSHRAEFEDMFHHLTYIKGSAIISMIESWTGATQFRSFVRDYVRTYADQSIASEDMIAVLERTTAAGFIDPVSGVQAGDDVGGAPGDSSGPTTRSAPDWRWGPILKSFLERPGVPLVRAQLMCQGADVRVALEQLALRNSYPAPPEHEHHLEPEPQAPWHIPLCMRYGDDDTAARTCTVLQTSAATVDLPTNSCPAWLVVNGDAGGYFLSAMADAQVHALTRASGPTTAGQPGLSEREATELALSLRLLLDHELISFDTALASATGLAQDRDASRHRLMALVGLWRDIGDILLAGTAESVQQRFADRVRQVFGRRAHELGMVRRVDDDNDDILLRPPLVEFVGSHGRDPALRRRAHQLAQGWLRDDGAIAPGLIATTLRMAAIGGGQPWYHRLLRTFGRSESDDATRRQVLLSALAGLAASSSDPVLQHQIMELARDRRLSREERYRLLADVVRVHDAVPAGLDWFERNQRALVRDRHTNLLTLVPIIEASLCSSRALERAAALGMGIGGSASQSAPLKRYYAEVLQRARQRSGRCEHFRRQYRQRAIEVFSDGVSRHFHGQKSRIATSYPRQ